MTKDELRMARRNWFQEHPEERRFSNRVGLYGLTYFGMTMGMGAAFAIDRNYPSAYGAFAVASALVVALFTYLHFWDQLNGVPQRLPA